MKSIITITIDTEFSTHKDDLGIFGEINGIRYGVPMLMDLLDAYQLKATFFVDVYSVKTEYLEKFKELCRQISANGHDLQLHTHPGGMFDKNREMMHQYSARRQSEIMAKGIEIFQEWFGVKPIAHRAGDWAADYNTLVACRVNQLKADCSMFYGWPACQLNNPGLTKNQFVQEENLLEIPAGVYKCMGLGLFKPYRLISTDGNTFEETWSVIKKMRMRRVPVVTTVYHSFSFLKWNKKRTEYKVVKNRIKKFEQLLKAISQEQTLEVKTIAQICDLYASGQNRFLMKKDVVVRTGAVATFSRIMDRLK